MLDRHGESWRQWLLQNVELGCEPRQMLAAMLKSSVWYQDHAIEAIKEAFKDPSLDLCAFPFVKDQPDFSIEGADIHVSARLTSPNVCVLDNVLSESECDEIIAIAEAAGLNRSGVVDDDTGVSVRHAARTSSSTYFHRAEHPIIDLVERRLSALTNWPIDRAEGLQLLKYEIGQQYKPHFDWFDDSKAGATKHLSRGGQRVGTTVLYLKAPELGGETSFPKIGLTISPKRGSAVFFRNITPTLEPDRNTLHAGLPVQKGEKIILTYWQREGKF